MATQRRAHRVLVGLADQMVYSLTNFGATLAVAHYATATQFGAFSLLTATQLILVAVNRGLCAEPVVVRTSAADDETWRTAVRAKLGVAAAFGVLAGLTLYVLCASVLPHQFEPYAVIYAFAPIVIFIQDFLRYAAMAASRPLAALANDLTVLLVQVLLVVAVASTAHPMPRTFVAIWVVASGCGLVSGLVLLRVRPCIPTRAHLAQDSDLAGRFAADNLLTQLSLQGVTYVVVASAGLAAAGGFRAAQTVFMPMAVLVLGLQTAMLPELVRLRATSVRAMHRALTRIAAGTVAASAAYVALAAVCPHSLGRAMFGASWQQARPLLVLVGLASIAGGPIYVAVAGLRAAGAASETLRVRWATAATTVVCVTAGACVDGARGAAVGLAISTVAQAALWWRQLSVTCGRIDQSTRAPVNGLVSTGARPSHREVG